MSKILHDMIHIYKPINLDWMNYRVVRYSDLTIHHIHKKADGGPKEINNTALLIETSHQYLNIIECRDLAMYIELNKIFKTINEQRHQPTDTQRRLVEEILQQFELEHKDDRNSKGKKLIKYNYLQRW